MYIVSCTRYVRTCELPVFGIACRAPLDALRATPTTRPVPRERTANAQVTCQDASAALKVKCGCGQGQGRERMLILDLAGTTTYRKLFHLLKVIIVSENFSDNLLLWDYRRTRTKVCLQHYLVNQLSTIDLLIEIYPLVPFP